MFLQILTETDIWAGKIWNEW